MGNPLTSEVAAFRWLVAVLVGAATVGLVAKLISPQAGIIWGMILIGFVFVLIAKGMTYLLGSPDEDEDEAEGEAEAQPEPETESEKDQS